MVPPRPGQIDSRSRSCICALFAKLDRGRQSVVPTHQTIPHNTETLLSRLLGRDDPLILDVGANRGQSYKSYRAMFPKAHIVCFEPDPETFALLEAALAGDPDARAVRTAVGARCGAATLYRNSMAATNSLAPMDESSPWANELRITRRDSISVPLTTLDAWLAASGHSVVDFAKFDIQGLEPEALEGMQQSLADRRVRFLQLELIPGVFYDRTTTFSDLERFLLPHGLRLLTIARIAVDDRGLLRACDVIYGL